MTIYPEKRFVSYKAQPQTVASSFQIHPKYQINIFTVSRNEIIPHNLCIAYSFLSIICNNFLFLLGVFRINSTSIELIKQNISKTLSDSPEQFSFGFFIV
jgi:hypothetical protein